MFEKVSLEVGGRTLTFETGKMARQAHGAVVARYGDSVVLATACMDNKATEKDFLPLTVDYREYTYSAGKIPGGFFKREGRPSEREISRKDGPTKRRLLRWCFQRIARMILT